MPEHCPECNAAMRSEPVQWRGLVRPVTAGDRRNRRDPKKKPSSAARAASVEYHGEVKRHYHCDKGGVGVAPAEIEGPPKPRVQREILPDKRPGHPIAAPRVWAGAQRLVGRSAVGGALSGLSRLPAPRRGPRRAVAVAR